MHIWNPLYCISTSLEFSHVLVPVKLTYEKAVMTYDRYDRCTGTDNYTAMLNDKNYSVISVTKALRPI